MAGGAALVDAQRQVAHLGDFVLHFDAHQHPAGAGFGSLAHHDFDGLGLHQVVGVESVAAGQHLINQLLGRGPFRRQHTAVAGATGGPNQGCRLAQRGLGVGRQRAVAHAADVDRGFQYQRVLGVQRPDDRPRVAAFLVAFQGEAGEASGKEGQVVEVGDFLEGRKAAYAVAAKLCLGVDVFHSPGRPDLAAVHYHRIALTLALSIEGEGEYMFQSADFSSRSSES